MLVDELVPIEDKFYLIDKPKTWTSFDAVRKIRNLGKFKKIGHAGTLDPLATGLLIICVGKYTKKIEYFQSLPKTYTGSFVLGKTTPSIDLETEFDEEYPIDHITPELLEAARLSLLGDIEQVPPIYSAVKQNGQRLYVQARKGLTEKDVEIKIRQASVYEFEIDTSAFPEIQFKIRCSKGTYIRSIVRDFGYFLNSGAYLNELVRSQIGDYSLEKAQSIEKFSADQYEILL
ncbi:tRNA pseudouridine(55) synthase TruB [Aquirufa nivalisilvae]|nr:tRNA pseudouridine(55) synthase TruB [Aquirufa nivalisilvae]